MAQHHEIGDVAPTSFAHLIGQRSVIEQVRVALDAAHQDAKKFDHALLVGPPGCGKTQTAKVIAQEMAAEFQEVLGQSVQNPADLNALLLGAKDRDIILIDEAHELDRGFQTALYLALDQRRVLQRRAQRPCLVGSARARGRRARLRRPPPAPSLTRPPIDRSTASGARSVHWTARRW